MRTEKFFGHGAFHGYWTLDPGVVEPRFGDEALLARLSAELHRRGMRLLLDLVVNHVAPEAPLARERPDWFHHAGPLRDFADPAQLTTHDVHGLPDLAQENPEVYSWLRRAAFRWIDRVHPDGFRLDAVKHVPLSFWARFNAEIRARAGPGFVLLGEDLDGNPAHLARTLQGGRFSHLFDFPLHFALVDVFCHDATAERIAAALTAGRAIGPDAALVTLVDNHDLPRIATACEGDLARVQGVLSALFVVRGVPAVQYGTEVGLPGALEPANRGDMRFDPSHGPSSRLHAAIRGGLRLRRAHVSLSAGETRFVEVTPELLVMTRATPEETAVIAIHRGTRPTSVAAPSGLRDLREAASGRTVGGRIRVAPRSVWIGFADGSAPPPRGVAEVVVEVPSASASARLSPGETLLAVGAHEALGAWDPARGVPFVAADAGLRVTVRLPDDAVHEMKLVVRPPTGAPRWQGGGNRHLFLRAGAGRQVIRLAD
jgi:glycosidase